MSDFIEFLSKVSSSGGIALESRADFSKIFTDIHWFTPIEHSLKMFIGFPLK